MQQQTVTAEIARSLLKYDSETGSMVWLRSKGAAAGGASAGHRDARYGYTYVCIFGRRYAAHRLAWLMTYGKWPDGEIDHKNGDRTDDRIANLRDVPHAVNTQNVRAAHRRSVTGLLGVRPYHRSGRFEACISVKRQHRSLGVFDTPEAAHAVYLAAKRRLHEGCTL